MRAPNCAHKRLKPRDCDPPTMTPEGQIAGISELMDDMTTSRFGLLRIGPPHLLIAGQRNPIATAIQMPIDVGTAQATVAHRPRQHH